MHTPISSRSSVPSIESPWAPEPTSARRISGYGDVSPTITLQARRRRSSSDGDPRDEAVALAGLRRQVVDGVAPDEDLAHRRPGALHPDPRELAAGPQVEDDEEEPA